MKVSVKPITKSAQNSAYPAQFFQMINGYTPMFSSFGGQLYEEALIRSAIEAKARHVSKLKIAFQGSAQPDLIRRLKDAPNAWQTWSQFQARLLTILDMQNTAFIIPVQDSNFRMVGLASILPSFCELREHEGEIWLRYAFANGSIGAVELARVGIMVKHQYRHDLFGESNDALTPTMELLSIQRQGITEAIKNGVSYRFMAEFTNFSKDSDIAKERQRFTETNLRSGEGGLLLFPSTFKNVKQVNSTPYVVDEKQAEMIRTNVFDYFGVNDAILQNKAVGDVANAFYESCIEPFALQESEVLTRMIFTERERAVGNRAVTAGNRIRYMTTRERLDFAMAFLDRGMGYIDTALTDILDLPPMPDGLGQHIPQRGEYKDRTEGGNPDADPA